MADVLQQQLDGGASGDVTNAELHAACNSLVGVNINNASVQRVRRVALCPEDEQQLFVNVFNLIGDEVLDPNVTWSTGDTDVATVDSTGNVTAMANGTTFVKVTHENCASHQIPVLVTTVPPDIAGAWSGSGTESVTGCLESDDEGVFADTAVLSIDQVENGDETNTIGVSVTGAGFAGGFTATAKCAGFEGEGTYTEMEPCEEGQPEICVTSGTVKVKGSITGIEGMPGDSIGNGFAVTWTTQDTEGDTCRGRGCRGGPVGVLAGQEAAVVRLVNLGVDQCIHLVVHCQQQLAVFLRVDSEVLHLVRIRLEIEQLDVVQLEDALQGARLVVLFGREVSAVLVAPVEHTADGSPLREIRLVALLPEVFLGSPAEFRKAWVFTSRLLSRCT